jgi:hypothetical protein
MGYDEYVRRQCRKREVEQELEMDYDELVAYLLKKHGAPEYDYFTDESCSQGDDRGKRGNKGLQRHHIDEIEKDGYILSDPNSARLHPFAMQKADRLVYCDLFEHLILHIKIDCVRNEKYLRDGNEYFGPGTQGISGEINEWYFRGENRRRSGKRLGEKSFLSIKNDFETYVLILDYAVQQISQVALTIETIDNAKLHDFHEKAKRQLCHRGRGTSEIWDKLYEALSKRMEMR